MFALVATDGTRSSILAISHALELFRPDAEVALVTVVRHRSDPNEDATGFAAPVLSEEDADRLHREEVVEGHGALAHTARALGPRPFAQQVLEGDPGPALCDYAEDVGADVIVVGSHGKGPLAKALLGSVSSYVVRHAPCAVLVVPEPPEGDGYDVGESTPSS